MRSDCGFIAGKARCRRLAAPCGWHGRGCRLRSRGWRGRRGSRRCHNPPRRSGSRRPAGLTTGLRHRPGPQQLQGPASAVAAGVELRVESASGRSDRARKSLSRLAAVRSAFSWVVSIITVPVSVPSAARAAKIWSKTPARLQLRGCRASCGGRSKRARRARSDRSG